MNCYTIVEKDYIIHTYWQRRRYQPSFPVTTSILIERQPTVLNTLIG